MKEGRFYGYMKFPTELLFERYRFYVPFFKGKKLVLDLGCGPGVFLDLMAKEGIRAVGVDVDEDMIDACQKKKLNVVKADLRDFLAKTKEEFDGIFCAHLIENFEVAQGAELVTACYQRLTKDGVLVMVTPNPSCLNTHLNDFWRDPFHVRMYGKELLAFVFAEAGFKDVQTGENTENRLEHHFSLSDNVAAVEGEAIKQYRVRLPEREWHGSKLLSPWRYLKFRVAKYLDDRFASVTGQIVDTVNDSYADIQKKVEGVRKNQAEQLKALNAVSPYPETYVVGRR